MPVLRRTAARALTATAALATGITLLTAAPAQADNENDHDFLAALSNAGMGARDTNTTVALGQSICPALVKPGSSFVEAAATARQGGVPPALAGFFAGLAIQHYCPQMISRVADGSFVDQLSMLRGMNIPGL
ncbi:DUF732 domain-containing protein [Mycolicibacterium fallax]|uniref:Uncharacterized protein n=1 Tax=Mycolicibacterium fallax TaxID=1793 RepID=A0A1X1QYT8_MYCFA|nr:DUF732 domain-containing protein [Mycolicibacterium fallax]ORU96632.1 hypothetical protein AWC04_18705 [Mycolicibacterium fallax]BBY98045.1 hypothetical protein MFAL_15120 [Mycolicibacterium fallax]HOW95733.1 DUF732 domain-containing protein [Mycolicibacterium fallax]HSA41600.1 DUF732 domain-containing protein [Mycobacterium sp.]